MVPSNLRILKWQVCMKKDRLEFLVPWRDLQLGNFVSQFLSIYASKYSDFSLEHYWNRAFSFLFSDGLQAVESHKFPQYFVKMKQQVGLAPATIILTQRSSDSSVLKPLDINKSLQHNSRPVPSTRIHRQKQHS